MKQFYYCLLLFGISSYLNAQDMGGIPVEGLVPIKKIENNKKTAPETNSAARMLSPGAITPTGSSTEVGITEGQLSVSLTGAASYTIPIMAPPGINGVMPEAGLAYNSQGSNGMAGYGWNIAGVSSITRMSSTAFHDSNIDPVDFDNLDRFALDGQRLVLKTGSIYGANGAIYETENFSTIKVTSYGTHPSGSTYGPSYFLVEYPDGSKAYYGYTSDSRSIIEYSISYWENPQGVRIGYSYNNTNNSLSIASINYGAVGAASPINKIQFNYGTSAKPEQIYIGGQSIIQDKILNSIVVTSNAVGFRSYWLSYNPNSLGYQRLASITEKSGDGTKSFNPTVFTYEDTQESISYADFTTGLSIGNINSSNAETVSGDFDGNENMEFLIYPTTGTDSKKKYWLFSDIGTGTNTNFGYEHNVGEFETIFPVSWLTWNNKLWDKQGWSVAKKTNTNYTFTIFSAGTVSPIYYQYERVVNFPTQATTEKVNCKTVAVNKIFPKKILSGDFNGDGLSDVIAIDMDLEKVITDIFCRTITSYITSKKVYFVDLKRDNATNFLTYSGELLANLTSKSRVEVADVNGDGKSDFMVFENGKVTTYTLSNTNQLIMLWNYPDSNISIENTKTIIIGDYNGDGKTDFIIPKSYGSTEWHKYTSTGTNFVKAIQTYTGVSFLQNNSTNTYNYIASDYDKDGKSDLILTSSNRSSTLGNLNVKCYKNRNGAFSSSSYNQGNSGYNASINLNPLPVYLPTGKGIQSKDKPYNPTLEIAFLSDNKIFYFNSNKDNSKDQLLRAITTGNGVTESITYKPLNSDIDYNDDFYEPIYNSSYSESYPNTDIKTASSLNVVSMLEKQSSTDYSKQLYSYFGAVSNVEGLGFLGFKAAARTNWFNDNNPIITTVSKYDSALRGANTESYTVLGYYSASDYVAPSNFITKTTATYSSTLSANKVFNLKLNTSQEFNGLNNTSTETSAIVYDAYHNPTLTTTVIKEGGSIQQTTLSEITYAPPTNSPYVVGRPTNKKQSVSISGDTMTKEEQYSYNTGGLLTQIKKKGHNTNFITEVNQYDAYGNITQKTISASNVPPRVTKFEYDTSSHRFLTKSTDIEGLVSNYGYNANYGLLISETNPYGLTTTYTYDAWFKKISKTDYLSKNYQTIYARNGGNTIVTNTGDDDSATVTEFDDLGRKIKTGVKDLNGNYSYVSYLYDIYSRNYKVSEPYSSSPSQWNETYYDNYGRTIQNSAYTGKTTNITYNGLSTTVNDGTLSKTITNNAIGNMVSITDSPGGTINYTYFANGNLKTSNYDGIVTTIDQDGWGRKTKLTDPSAGEYNYTYNEIGQAQTETTPNGSTIYSLSYYGKVSSKKITGTNTNSQTSYVYDNTTKLLNSSTYTDVLANNAITTTTYSYDGYKRLMKSVEITPYATFTKEFTYDGFGRLDTEKSIASAVGKSSTKTIKHTYKNGFAWQMIDMANQQVLWQTNAVNARGQLTSGSYGNGLALSQNYDTYGYIERSRVFKTGTNTDVLNLYTTFEPLRGNLTSRTNSLFNWTENFQYDTSDRLSHYTNAQGIQVEQMYENDGRIKENTLGTYNYSNSAKKYQNTSIDINPSSKAYYENRAGLFNEGMEQKTGWMINDPNLFTYDSTVGKTGTTSLKMNNTTSGEIVAHAENWIKIDNAVATEYTYSTWVKSDGSNPAAEIFLFMKTENETGYFTNVDSKIIATSTNWVQIEKTFLVPANIKKLNIRLDNNATGVLWFDDVRLYKTSDAIPQERQLNITYNTWKSPYEITETGVDKISFTYNDNNSRSTMFYGGLQTDKLQRQYRKHYSADGSMEIKHNTVTGAVEFVTYIGGDGYTAPVVLKSDGTTQEYLYLHRDYLNSIVAITNQAGNVVEKRLFDAWGDVVKIVDGQGTVLSSFAVLDRGYTGHEHLQSVGLINMNGRLYDAKMHRFLQPDNYVQDLTNTQNFNRYGYVLNNPLKYTDFSGEKWKIKLTWSDVFAAASIVAGTALVIFGGPAGAALGAKLIYAGATHFLFTTVSVITEGKSWVDASNYIGFQSPTVTINTDWGYGKDKKNGAYQDIPVVEPNSDSTGEINKNAVPCVQCHHQTTFSVDENNAFNSFNFADRQSGYVQYGGEMRSDFIGSSVGKNGFIYNSYSNPFALSDHRTKINFLNYLSDVMGGLGTGYDFASLFYGDADINIRTFNYTTKDTLWMIGGYRDYYILKNVNKKGYIINKDTIK
ncbi:RHS repeat-associated protein [Mariniflexile fucanivorans]|uniref:RHS repeat-associated protein n=1 Tax=Mariniflexile fucanivorans TaxID=264023 RepID=A0A4R1R8V8_9FLAO|nr:RHS repeat-associated core domain-containing protein [Mariniflexile fucanivorans]TCL62115.1 RHS repeat-associated protein [Mariniflexile fucanivorans]